MKLKSINIKNYCSIKDITINFPKNKPVILFGPNSSGKSLILNSIHKLLGEKYPLFMQLENWEYFNRDKKNNPTVEIRSKFTNDETLNLIYGYNGDETKNVFVDQNNNPISISNEYRNKCISFFINSKDSIESNFDVENENSLIIRVIQKLHKRFSKEIKENISSYFDKINLEFTKDEVFSKFINDFNSTLTESIKGFVHKFDANISFDSDNYAKTLQILATNKHEDRRVGELSAGETQIFFLAFVKAYMEIFSDENIVLIIEEPEQHLHPLAQKWIKEFIKDLCDHGIQIILSTHSTSFIDVDYLEGLVRVYKDNGITNIIQLNKDQLYNFCISSGASKYDISKANIVDYYKTKMFSDQLNGLFSEKVVFVEGFTEYFALPIYLKKINYSLPINGIEFVVSRGKEAIPLMIRLYKAYGYKCFVICDGDGNLDKTNRTFKGILPKIELENPNDLYILGPNYLCFTKDFETYFRNNLKDYSNCERKIKYAYHVSGKPSIAKAVAEIIEETPELISKLTSAFEDM